MRVTRNDRGVTLTEVLVAVAILTIIIVPLGGAFVAFFRNTDATSQRLSENHDAQLAAAYFVQDVQSLGVRSSALALQQSVELKVARNSGIFRCGGPGTPEAAVRFGLNDPESASGSPTLVKVAYVVWTVGAERQLRRLTCIGSSTTPVSDIVVAHNLDPSATPPPVDVSCSTSCTAAAVPRTVTMTLRLRHPDRDTAAFVVTLTGHRRQT